MTRILYLRPRNITNPLHPAVCSPLLGEVAKLAHLDDILHDPSMTEDELADLIRQYDVILTMWQTPRLPDSLATNPGRLRYICNVTGEMKTFVSQALIDSPYLTVTNWGDSTAPRVAEGAMTLLLAMLKSLNVHYDSQKAGGQGKPDGLYPGSLWRLPVGIYGMGAIGRSFVQMIRPFQPVLMAYDPYVPQMPEGVEKLDSLDELFQRSKAIVIHAGLSPETRHTVTAECLAMLPDHAILINTARGGIIDQEAALKEALSGRLRMALDVLETDDKLPADHPARQCSNLLLTSHAICNDEWSFDGSQLDSKDLVCLDNLKRFMAGQPLRFVMTPERYQIST